MTFDRKRHTDKPIAAKKSYWPIHVNTKIGSVRPLDYKRLCEVTMLQDNQIVDDQEQIAFERAVARELAGLEGE
jgi:hypothetical protein